MSELIGRRLGKYTLESSLGEGGMAAVFRSHHPQFDRPVAIKILPPTVGQDPGFRARFEREGRTIASLNHPNIIRVYDIDEADGLFYMVMDLLPGGTLEARLREGGLDRKWSTDVILKMAEALDYAHTRGVVHRDIKPSNILLDADGAPVLADFGIAKLVLAEGDPNLTGAGMVMGTPAYMAPEQLTGQPPDARSDIYSLGVVLYQLLTGHAPFTGDTTAVISGHLTRQPQPPRERVPDLPPSLDAVVLQALAKQPEHRFRSASVFAQALRSAAADLEPGLVRVASAARGVAVPSFSGASLPSAGGAAAAPTGALTIGQQVAKYLPVALAALGLLLVISLILKYWLLVTLFAILIGGGGFLFLYLRANAQGRKAARATTRAITTSAALPASASASSPEARNVMSTGELPSPTRPLDEPDDVPEVPLPEDVSTLGVEVQLAGEDQAPTQAVASETDRLTPTEAVAAAEAPAQLAAEVSAQDLAPTEVVSLGTADPQAPTEALPAAKDAPPADAAPATHSRDIDAPVQPSETNED
jgi:serine/threonine-protein kinase